MKKTFFSDIPTVLANCLCYILRGKEALWDEQGDYQEAEQEVSGNRDKEADF